MKIQHILLPAALLCGSAVLLVPQESEGFTTIGGSLNLSQRTVRVFNNFEDVQANDNQVVNTTFPGAFGAPQAIWKAVVEWGSELHGNGSGDPHQNGGLGSGGANFDAAWLGLANQVGGTNDNIASALLASGGGVLAFVETPISDGWRMRFYENWGWADGPGTSIGNNIDLQGVATHEYGHSLGLGHTNVSGATMTPSINGNGVVDRSIAADDIAGVQAIYGVKSANKPRITGLTVNGNGTITITGTNFSSTGNQVWFSRQPPVTTKSALIVSNVTSNGTSITVTVPAGAGPGDVLVRNNGTGNANLSNAWPANLAGGVNPGPTAPEITGVTPAIVPAVNVDGSVNVVITGTGFTGATSVVVDGSPLLAFPPQFFVSGDTQVSFLMPKVSKLGSVVVEIITPNGSDSIQLSVVPNNPPVLEVDNSNPGFLLKALGMTLSMGAQPFDTMFLFASVGPNANPTSLPGIFDLAIGDNFTNLFFLGQFQINPVTGRADLNIPLTTVPAGTFATLQAARLSFVFPSLPLEATNTQAVTVLF